jgi:hypothetical protein
MTPERFAERALIVSEEAPPKSTWWNDHLISLVRAYEKRKSFQHPIGYAALDSAAIRSFTTRTPIVALAARVSPAKSCGTGQPSARSTSMTVTQLFRNVER